MNNLYIQSVRNVTFYLRKQTPLTEARTNLSDTPRGEDGDRTSLSPEQTPYHHHSWRVSLIQSQKKKSLPGKQKKHRQENTNCHHPPTTNPTRYKSGNTWNTGELDR
ncbi:unnamed protein product [Meganyctiphanes norvegica]|uniref:Uncharacterized protein n=1 Tax=Meganyctiphanes norvegica TaxID=48144 RepID=A0AAV2SN14_MEGNR